MQLSVLMEPGISGQSWTQKPSVTNVKTEVLGHGRSRVPEVHLEICHLNIGLSPPAPGSAPGANRTPFRIHSNADNESRIPASAWNGTVMAETTAFVLLGVKTSAVLAPLRQNQV
ncbi:uncharacterized protein LOC135277261 [Aotus nancymaae]|uniref:uncharacterized protein LOC135277261 n=1 Tax=Aotus nancymaae TaxID=37293 RepID=UPI0030FE0ECD